MEDLFSGGRMAREIDGPAQDYEYRLWAERLIREVSEEVSNDERQARDFVRAWIRWRDLVSLVCLLELNMHKREAPGGSERQWHQTFLNALMALGGLLKEWSKGMDENALELAGFDRVRLDAAVESLKESFQMWHGATSAKRTSAIEAFLP